MSETIIWKVIEPLLVGEGGHCSRHEDKQSLGIPDISYGFNGVNGWIESKFIHKWPKPGNVVKFRKYTMKQRKWMEKRWMAAGSCYLILLVGSKIKDREFLVFSGALSMVLGKMTKKKMYRAATWYGNDRDMDDEFLDIFTHK